MNKITAIVSAAALAAGVAGCATAPTASEQDFGNAVRHMVQQQIYDPQAAAQPAADPPLAMDGARGEAALEAYRKQPQKPVSQEEVRIGVDGRR
jgi:hypothetical protein